MTATATGLSDAPGQSLRHWTSAQLDGLAAQLGRQLRAWAVGWGLDAVDAGQTAAEGADALPQDHGASDWLALHGAGAPARAWIAGPEGAGAVADQACALLQQALFGTVAPVGPEPSQRAANGPNLSSVAGAPSLSSTVADDAWNDLRATLADALRLAPADAPAGASGVDDCGPWSGAVRVRLPMPGSAWRLLLNGACVAQLVAPAAPAEPAKAAPPTPLLKALRGQTLTLRAALGDTEITLGALQALAVGDVIMLSHALDQPLSLSAADGRPVCLGFLGRQQGWRALELVAAVAPPRPAAATPPKPAAAKPAPAKAGA